MGSFLFLAAIAGFVGYLWYSSRPIKPYEVTITDDDNTAEQDLLIAADNLDKALACQAAGEETTTYLTYAALYAERARNKNAKIEVPYQGATINPDRLASQTLVVEAVDIYNAILADQCAERPDKKARIRDAQKMREILHHADELNPNKAPILQYLSFAYALDPPDYDKATEYMRAAVALTPDDVQRLQWLNGLLKHKAEKKPQ